ncbi:hypothetical protein [Sphingomonas sp. OTU376]|uniref:hypothetical protein n=1 Tax=Sphingomonas sp. OTU376 TaxID=3043863 RepID=UPI00313BAB58
MKPERISLKVATAEMIKGVGGLEAAAGFCRVGKSVLGEAQSISCPDRYVAIDVVADLEPLARDREGWPHVTRALCLAMGGVFVALPSTPPGREDLIGSVGRLAGEAADVTQAICGMVADEKNERHEIAAARVQVAEAMAVLAALDRQLQAMAGDA